MEAGSSGLPRALFEPFSSRRLSQREVAVDPEMGLIISGCKRSFDVAVFIPWLQVAVGFTKGEPSFALFPQSLCGNQDCRQDRVVKRLWRDPIKRHFRGSLKHRII